MNDQDIWHVTPRGARRFEPSPLYSRARSPWGGPSGSAAWGVCQRLLSFWDSKFESRRSQILFSLVSVVCCQVELSVSGWSLVQRNSTDCGASLCVFCKPQERGNHGPHQAAAPQERNIIPWRNPEGCGGTFLRSVQNDMPSDAASQPRRQESSITPLLKPQTSQEIRSV